MARSLCRFGRFDLARLPANRRDAALGLELQGWSPYADTDYAVAWTDDGVAQVWCWDRAALRAELAAQTPPVKPLRVIPETALRAPAPDGLRLCAALNGFEAEQWQGGQLLTSRWWPQAPAAAEWLAFQRSCGLPPEQWQPLPTPLTLPLADRPWRPLGGPGGSQSAVSVAEMSAYGALALVLGIPALVLGVSQLRLAQASSTAQAEFDAESARSQVVLQARDTALQAAEQVRALQDLQPFPAPLVLMQAIARALPETAGVSVREWEMNEGRLRLLLVAATGDIAGSDLVRALEVTGLFSDIKILTQADPRQIGLMLTLRPQSALAQAAEAAASEPGSH